MFTRAKNIYSGKKGQGEGTLPEDSTGPVLERDLHKNNMVLKTKTNPNNPTKQQPNAEWNEVTAQPQERGWMTDTPTGPSPLEPLPTFHGQEGFCCYLSSPQLFTWILTTPGPYLTRLLSPSADSGWWDEGDLGVMPMPAALLGKRLRQNPAGAAGEGQEGFRHLLLPTCMLEIRSANSLSPGGQGQREPGLSARAHTLRKRPHKVGGTGGIQTEGTARSVLLLHF